MVFRRSLILAALATMSFPLMMGCASYWHTERASTQVNFGKEVAKKGYWGEAKFRFEQAVAKDPNNAFAHNDLGVALEATGEYALALPEYKKALELAPSNKGIRENFRRFAEFYDSYSKNEGKVTTDAK